MRSRNIQLGINGERFVSSLFERTIGKKRLEEGWYQIKHQDWDNNYNYGTGVDIEILEDNKPLIDIEVKNFKKQSRPYGTDIALKEIIPRFDRSTAPIKLVFISFLCLLTVKAKQLIKQAGIEIIEIGNWIIKATWKETFKKFMVNNCYKMKSYLNLKPLRHKASKPRHNSSSCSLINSSISKCNCSYSNSTNNSSNMNKTHDTNIERELLEFMTNNNNSPTEQEKSKNANPDLDV